MSSTENLSEVAVTSNDDLTIQLIERLESKSEPEFFNNLDEISAKYWEFSEDHKSFIPLICEHGDEELAVTYGGGILYRFSKTPGMGDRLFDFANQKASTGSPYAGKTPLEIALSRNWRKMTEVLIENCADVTYTEREEKSPLEKIYTKFPLVMMSQFGKHIELIKNKYDEMNEQLWRVRYRYRPVIGTTSKLDSKKDVPPTNLLVEILQLDSCKRNEVLTHPLTRIFVHEEGFKFKSWIRASILIHIIWYIYTALFIIYVTTLSPKVETNSTINNSTVASSSDISDNNSTDVKDIVLGILRWCFVSFYYILFIFILSKECAEVTLAPNKKYYFRQLENIGQWLMFLIVIVLSVIQEIVHIDWNQYWKLIWVAGILDAGLLIQGQLTKTKTYGVYNILLQKAVTRFYKFAVAYSPLIFTFCCVFYLLLSKDKPEFHSFFGIFKVFTMFAGELDFKDTFNDGETPASLIGMIVFVLFVTIVTIILQNILVALTVDDIQELKLHCVASHIAAELELIHILEVFKPVLQRLCLHIRRRCCPRSFEKDILTEVNGHVLEELNTDHNNSETDDSLPHNKWNEKRFEDFPQNIKDCIKAHFRDRI